MPGSYLSESSTALHALHMATAKSCEVLFSPAEFMALQKRDLSRAVCVVFDTLRATTSMTFALANGAAAVLPVNDIPDALALRVKFPEALLAGERHGIRIGADLTCGVEFDLGNSPPDFTPSKVAGRKIIMTTTNGTRALQACAGAKQVFIGSFPNLTATANAVLASEPEQLFLVCAGTYEEAAYEDTLAAGAMAELVEGFFGEANTADSVAVARNLWLGAKADLAGAIRHSRNGRRLLAHPDLKGDVAVCLQRDTAPIVATMVEGAVRILRTT